MNLNNRAKVCNNQIKKALLWILISDSKFLVRLLVAAKVCNRQIKTSTIVDSDCALLVQSPVAGFVQTQPSLPRPCSC